MPVLNPDSPRIGQQHLQNLLLQSSVSHKSSPPALTRIDHQSWRGRKRSRSPSTSPVTLTERMWRPWKGAAEASGEREGWGRGVGTTTQGRWENSSSFAREMEGFGGDLTRSYSSGVNLVIPSDPPRQTTSSIALESGGIGVNRIHNDASSSAITPRLGRSSHTSGQMPLKGSHARPQDINHSHPTESSTDLSGRPIDRGSGTADVVPVWDINASRDGRRSRSSGSHTASSRAMKSKTLATGTGGSEGDVPHEIGNSPNPNYVQTNAILHDLVSARITAPRIHSNPFSQHAQRLTRRPPRDAIVRGPRNDVRSTTNENGKRPSRSPSPRSMTIALPVSPSASINSTLTASSDDRDAERALLVAGYEGSGMRYGVDGISGAMTNRGRLSPVRRRRMLSYDSEEESLGDDGEVGGKESTGDDASRRMSGALPSGYEDMNRLLGRLAIQRRGCRRA